MKFRLSEKLKYMVLGSLLTLAGFMFGNMSSDTEAQLGSETINELTVRELTVLKDIKISSNSGDSLVLISSDEEGGIIATNSNSGDPRVLIRSDSNGGQVFVVDSSGRGAARLAVTEKGGTVSTRGEGKAGVIIRAGGEGEGVSVFGTDGKLAVSLGITEDGGMVATDGKGKAGVIIGTTEVGVFNREGQPRAAFKIIDGKGVAFLFNRFGERRVLEP